MKKILTIIILFLGTIGFFVSGYYKYEKTIPYEQVEPATGTITEMNEMMNEEVANYSQGSFFEKFLGILGIKKYFTDSTNPQNPTLNKNASGRYIVVVINYGIMSIGLIAMLFLIYGFAMMFFGKDDEGFTKAKTIIRNSFIAIAVIALSWFLTTFIIYFYYQVKEGPNDENIGIHFPHNIERVSMR